MKIKPPGKLFTCEGAFYVTIDTMNKDTVWERGSNVDTIYFRRIRQWKKHLDFSKNRETKYGGRKQELFYPCS